VNQSGSFYFPTGPVSVVNISAYIPSRLAAELTSAVLPPARLYCADLTSEQIDRIRVRWWFDYDGAIAGVGSSTFVVGSSPPITLFYGLQGDVVNLIALEDDMDKANLLWSKPSSVSSLGLLEDSRGGVWRYENSSQTLISFNISTGDDMQRLDMSMEGAPASRGLVSSSLPSGEPMLVACFSEKNTSSMIAIRLLDGTIQWRYPVNCQGQITLMDPDGLYRGGLVVTLTTNLTIVALG